jgi:acetyltransferase-like isoleucine patch superfamily enzyme
MQGRKMMSPYFLLSSFVKTIRFNFRYFEFRNALKLPVIISHNVYLKKMGGHIKVNGELKRGMIRIGFGDIGIFDKQRSRCIWFVTGRIIFNGRTDIGHSVKINVHETGILEFGEKFLINAESAIICRKNIVFGRQNLISWQCMITDTDFHKMHQNGVQLNEDRPVHFGDKVWVGMQSTVLKGVKIADGAVIGAGSIISKNLDVENSAYGGNPAKLLKNDITWTL